MQKTKDCYASICNALIRKGISCDEVDIRAETDSKLSCEQNKQHVLKIVGTANRKEAGYYNALYEQFTQSQGIKVKKPCVPPVRVKAHSRGCCPMIQVRAYVRSCPTFRIH